jgi:hypothetical protein
MFRKNTRRYAWVLVLSAGLFLLAGSPLVLRSQAGPEEPVDAAVVEQKLAELENASRQAGLTGEETKAVVALARRVQADKRELFKLQACGKVSDVEQRAMQKLVSAFGHPLERELAEVRQVAAEAGLTAEETAAAEKVALQEGFNNDAIICRYETGKMSPVEKAAFEKVIALKGHPRAEEIQELTEVARQAGLSDQQLQTLRGLAARAAWDLETIKEWKRTNQLSEAESSALDKLAPEIARLQSRQNAGQSEKARKFRQVAKVAGLTDAETEALQAAIQQAGSDEYGLLEAKRAGTLSASAAAGLKKLEGLMGKLEDFVASPHKKEIGKLLEASSQAGLTAEETGVIVKLAVRVNFDLEAAKQLKAAGRLSEVEVRALDKLRTGLGL